MDLNIENVGLVEGWSPPVGNVLSPGFKATADSMLYMLEHSSFDSMRSTRVFIDKLEQKGYCIAKYDPE